MKILSAEHFWSKELAFPYKLAHIVLGCIIFFIIFYIFYHNYFIAAISMVLTFVYIRAVDQFLQKSRNQMIVQQFNQFLYSLSSALVAGRSVENAFREIEQDLKLLYPDETSFIIRELRAINNRVSNGLSLENSLLEFSKLQGNQDIKNFAIVFSVCKRSGGDLVEVIKKTANIITNKIELEQEIEILIARKKFEARLISLAPVVIIGLITWSASDYMTPLYGNPLGQMVMSIALLLIFLSTIISNLIMDIKV